MGCMNLMKAVIPLHRDDSEASALPRVGFGQTVRSETTLQVVAARLQASSLYRPLLVRAGLSVPAAAQQLYVSLKPSAWRGAGLLVSLPVLVTAAKS